MSKEIFLGLNQNDSEEAINILQKRLCTNLMFVNDVIDEIYNIGEDWLAEHISSNKEEYMEWITK